jgi:hypothetical protein
LSKRSATARLSAQQEPARLSRKVWGLRSTARGRAPAYVRRQPQPRCHGRGGELDSRLFYRLSSLAIQPPLRDHREDVPDIANFMLAQLIETGVCPVRRLTTPAMNQLRNFDWPGNLPQLNNVVRTLAVTALSSEIDATDVNRVLAPMKQAAPAVAHGIPLDIALREARDAFERIYFEHHPDGRRQHDAGRRCPGWNAPTFTASYS